MNDHGLAATLSIVSEDESADVRWTVRTPEDGLAEVDVAIQWPETVRPRTCRIRWTAPMVDIHAKWHPGTYLDKGLLPNYARGVTASATTLAPVVSLFNVSGKNAMTFASSDVLNPLVMHAGVDESTAEVTCGFDLFTEPTAPIREYRCTVRVDTRPWRYHRCIEAISTWWSADAPPAAVPAAAREPAYSTWYSFHQDVTAASVEQQAQLAARHGFGAIIVDDGWQASTSGTGYESCGDWQPSQEKFPDMARHVQAVQALGLRYLLWFSVPHVGEGSRAYERFASKMLGYWPEGRAWVLDPRFPEVREYLISTYERAVREWKVDGLKLDFVDSFRFAGLERTDRRIGRGRDLDSVPVAVDLLLSDTLDRLRALNPDILIEFRQSYVGPLMRTYGNMLRAADCPNDAIRNRVSVIDMRLISGDTAVHSDMLMWNARERRENVALQFINTIFATPQVSVRLDTLDPALAGVIDHWLRFGQEHRDLLTSSPLTPVGPERHYSAVRAGNDQFQMIASYSEGVIDLTSVHAGGQAVVLNGTGTDGVVVDLGRRGVGGSYEIRNCVGRVQGAGRLDETVPLIRFPVPAAGYITIALGRVKSEPVLGAR